MSVARSEEPDWGPEVWPRVNELNFILALQRLGAILRVVSIEQRLVDPKELVVAYVAALMATELKAEVDGVRSPGSKMGLFSEGLEVHGPSEVPLPLIPTRGPGSLWKREIRLAHAYVRVSRELKLEGAEVVHALVHGDPEVSIEPPLAQQGSNRLG